MRYLIEDDNDLVRLSSEGLRAALDIAYGVDYGTFGIDPFEAAVLLAYVRDFAAQTGESKLLISCNAVRAKLRPHIEAFAIMIDRAK